MYCCIAQLLTSVQLTMEDVALTLTAVSRRMEVSTVLVAKDTVGMDIYVLVSRAGFC